MRKCSEINYLITKGLKKTSTMEARKYFEMNDNENTTYQNLRDTEVVLRGKITNAYIRKEEKFKTNDIIFHHMKLQKSILDVK